MILRKKEHGNMHEEREKAVWFILPRHVLQLAMSIWLGEERQHVVVVVFC
jgi:hypothetical protein